MNKVKFLLCLALLVSGVEGRGQIYINSYRFAAAVSDSLLLDFYPNADIALSLRKLDKDYTGNCITVRRVNGDTSLIGFSGNYLDTIALKNFCGTTSTDTCWVRRWFDQSGNARNMVQTTSANQPRILTAGNINYQGNQATIFYDGGDFFTGGNILSVGSNSLSTFAVAKRDTLQSGVIYAKSLASSEAARYALTTETTNDQYFLAVNTSSADASIFTSNFTSASRVLYNQEWIVNTSHKGYRNNTEVASRTANVTTIGTSTRRFLIGAYNNATDAGEIGHWDGNIQEVIFYLSNKSSDRSNINANINDFYSIY